MKAGLVDPLQRDTVAQNYQQSRSGLLGQEANFENGGSTTIASTSSDFPPTFR